VNKKASYGVCNHVFHIQPKQILLDELLVTCFGAISDGQGSLLPHEVVEEIGLLHWPNEAFQQAPLGEAKEVACYVISFIIVLFHSKIDFGARFCFGWFELVDGYMLSVLVELHVVKFLQGGGVKQG